MAVRLSAALAVGVFLLGWRAAAQAQKAPDVPANDEVAVYAAVLNSLPNLSAASRLLIADRTSTFACDNGGENGFNIGGCNGLRTSEESPSDRMAIVRRDIPELESVTVTAFEGLNERSVAIIERIPALAAYYLFSQATLPKGWTYTHLVYFSKAGFNPAHTQALVYVGILSATDANESKGKYFVLTKRTGKWVLGPGSAVWELAPRE
jgi:hypothetical protein